jgi:hypothetical protein
LGSLFFSVAVRIRRAYQCLRYTVTPLNERQYFFGKHELNIFLGSTAPVRQRTPCVFQQRGKSSLVRGAFGMFDY